MPTGIHDCGLTEIESVFVYNDKRHGIWNSFRMYLSQVAVIPEVNVIYIDGSFVTDKSEPNDIDLVLEFTDSTVLSRVVSNYPTLFDQKVVKANFDLDLYLRLEILPSYCNDLREFFQYLRPEEAIKRGVPIGTRKGILKISLDYERKQRTI